MGAEYMIEAWSATSKVDEENGWHEANVVLRTANHMEKSYISLIETASALCLCSFLLSKQSLFCCWTFSVTGRLLYYLFLHMNGYLQYRSVSYSVISSS